MDVTAAKKFFEDNATDLQNVTFVPHSQTRSTSQNNLTPDWNSAETTGTGKIITIEIPLKGDAIRAAQTFQFGSKKDKCSFTSRVTTKLVIQKHMQSGVMRQFVATLVDGISQVYRKEQEREYNSRINYFGYVIISSVTGEYLDAFRSVDGKWSRFFFQAGPPEDRENPDNVGMKLFDAGSSPTSYQFGETPVLCQKCYNENGYTTICLCCKHCDGSGCDYCMATVTNCRKCRNPVESCRCCFKCRNYPCTCPAESFCKVCWRDPCTCKDYRCEHCGNLYCNGSCQGTV